MVVEVLDLTPFFNMSNSNSKELILSANNLTWNNGEIFELLTFFKVLFFK